MTTNDHSPQPVEQQFEVMGLQLAAQRWRTGSVPVIALHGWLDNSESFAAMAAHMPAVDLVALDLAGHGLSGHRAAHASYLIWDDLREILAVADALGWQRFALLGHSRGAIIASLLAAAVPERVTALGLIDGLWAQTCEADLVPQQLARALAAASRPHKERHFASQQALVAIRQQNGFALSREAAERLVARSSVQGADGQWRWRSDLRLKWPSLMMLTPEQQLACHRALAMPVELALASRGLAQAWPDYAERLLGLPHINWSLYEGGHHLHMEEGNRILGNVFNGFFQRA